MFSNRFLLPSLLAPSLLALAFALSLPCATAASDAAKADPKNIPFEEPVHGLSTFGELRYPPDFTHFDYVNPSAPKGGILSHVGTEQAAFNASFYSFDTLNGYILKGHAAQDLHLIFDSLMVRAFDEPDALYGLVAKNVARSKDGNAAIFSLRPEARFHDGTPLTAHDAAFSLKLLQKDGHPLIAQNMKEVAEIRALSQNRLFIQFTGSQKRSHILFLAQLPIFSKKFYTTHDFRKASMVPPLGSGPYAIGKFEAGRFVSYIRQKNYWARDLPVNRGRWNFDHIRLEYFRDETAQFEAFKSRVCLFREEFTSKVWAKEYDFPARQRGEVRRMLIPDNRPSGAQGWFINLRREQFKKKAVRQALELAFDFPWMNRNQFYDAYTRTESFFETSIYKAEGLPSEEELAFLRPLRALLDPSVFGAPHRPPRADGSGRDRAHLRRAASKLQEAGWVIRNGKRVNERGEILKIEFLGDVPDWERILAPYVRNLRFLGIEATIRFVDSAQYRERLKRFDFDIIVERFTIANTPGIELRSLFASDFADIDGSRNLSGLKDPAVDALLENVTAAQSQAELIHAARALDRALRSLFLWVPQWHATTHRLAFWDIYERPALKPFYARGVIDRWWFSHEKAKRLGIP